MEELLDECGTEELYGGSLTLPQTLFADKVRKVKDRLEELHRRNPEEFYRRKSLIQQAIKEREKGKEELMPDFTLEELRDILKFTEGLYR